MTFENLRVIESILTLGSKDTTYKLALLRAILDHMIEHPVGTENSILSLTWIACKFLSYYWPLFHHKIPQGPHRTTRRETAIEGYVDKSRRVTTCGSVAQRTRTHASWLLLQW
jgi:hypothetical protein